MPTIRKKHSNRRAMRQRTAKGTNQRNSEETPQTTLQTLEIERRHLLPISHFFALRIEQALLTRVIFSLPLQILISVTGRAREKFLERRNFFLNWSRASHANWNIPRVVMLVASLIDSERLIEIKIENVISSLNHCFFMGFEERWNCS